MSDHLTAFVQQLADAGVVPPLGPSSKTSRRMPPGWSRRDSMEAKYEARVVRSDGCWGWIGHVNPVSGYAYIGKTLAHRWAHEQFIGPIPEAYEVDHLCSVRTCTNPAHLEAVTGLENTRRALRKDACKQGHPWTDASTYITPSTRRRMCRICAAAKMRRFRARRTAARKAAA